MQSSEFEQEVLRLTNEFRAENGLPPLTMNEELARTAENHSEAMAEGDFFSHTGLNGSAPWDRAEEEGYTANSMGENIAAGQTTPEQVVEAWINSPGHRENLLNPNYTEMGVGYVYLENDTGNVNYNHYWTQVFGSGDLTPDSPAQDSQGNGVDESIFEPVPEPVAGDDTPTAPERVLEPDFVGNDNNNVIYGNSQSNVILGLAGNDQIRARRGDDFVDGGAGSDRLLGSLGSDILIGGLGNDVLVGSGNFSAADGGSDIDILTGDEGADRFVLGNRSFAFYGLGGAEDYALITDLTVAEGDMIRLNSQVNYSLGAAPAGTANGQGLFMQKTNGSRDLVAVIQGAGELALTDEVFVYV
ncbi:MAG: calcium-binding protein [Leptolyngbyaceae cyanobacterium MAG.088]|nr:calcium-binding protein [Leptolyngbyaceae cyanobacterium MAG.088]